MNDVYYSPEKHGLESVGEIEWSDGDYCFDITAVWRRKDDGQLLYARDSGCSCPSPFEDYHSVDGLTAATPTELQEELDKTARESYSDNSTEGDKWAMQIAGLMGRIVNWKGENNG